MRISDWSSDVCSSDLAIDISNFRYKDYTALHNNISDQMWSQAQTALKVAASNRLNVRWYAKLFEAETIRSRYNNGYWIQFHIYRDLRDLFQRQQNTRSEEHTSELQSLMRNSYAVFCFKTTTTHSHIS